MLDELEIRKITGDTIARPGCYFETARREASLQQPHHNGITPWNVRDVVRMANQITDFFAVYPKQEALDGIAKHIHATWEPRLRNTLKAHLDTGGAGLKPLCIEAMTGYFRGPNSPNARRVDPTRSDAPTGAEPSFADEGGDGG